jgi:hypothetical protein
MVNYGNLFAAARSDPARGMKKMVAPTAASYLPGTAFPGSSA